MTTTSRYRLLVDSLALISIAALLAMSGGGAKAQNAPSDGANAQNSPADQAAPYYAAGPFTADGSVIVNGEIVGRDPDQRIRSGLLRENGSRYGD